MTDILIFRMWGLFLDTRRCNSRHYSNLELTNLWINQLTVERHCSRCRTCWNYSYLEYLKFLQTVIISKRGECWLAFSSKGEPMTGGSWHILTSRWPRADHHHIQCILIFINYSMCRFIGQIQSDVNKRDKPVWAGRTEGRQSLYINHPGSTCFSLDGLVWLKTAEQAVISDVCYSLRFEPGVGSLLHRLGIRLGWLFTCVMTW